ncbi:hypothetical protein OG455_41225 [Kitasatospora sp. NBC_01287]|uniref:hypothetical protein n=1 Tax=Kitasatospora sp. NBC_01287 TaxID=2903573 RepID=UPI00225879F9|nr:hypothetical protein [Kitasatospora sp. NBC_01287]MCX4750905.1 hypothetical protein [Kitasatospora sp. NBC_01287]MCX4751864.1 hypothetical protein [Kitasatospora sp. NBC_01287]
MRLYSRTGATALDDPEYGHFEADADGGFDLPDPLAAREHGFAVRGARIWETDIERQHRLIAEEVERRKDPATLLQAVEQLVNAQSNFREQSAAETPAKRTSKRTTSSRGAE